MKIREIILDFTSLLDIFMLILFFFILFSHFEVEEVKETAQQTMNEAAAVMESAEAMRQQAEEELELLEDANHGKAVDLVALMQISRGTLIQSRLIMDESGDAWTLVLYRMDDSTKQKIQLAILQETDAVSQEITAVLQNQECTAEDKIPFIFLYDGTEIGSETAYSIIDMAFREVRRFYPHFYCVQIDISDFGGNIS